MDDAAPDENALPFYDPLILYGTCQVQPNSASSPNSAALSNPHNLPMEILEIRFRIYSITARPPGNVPIDFAQLTGQAIGVKLDLGTVPVVDARVPVNGFGTSRDDDDGTVAVWSDPSNIDASKSNPSTYTWRLKYPLYIPPNTVLVPSFEHLGQSHLPAVVDIMYVARSLPEDYQPPKKLKVPWVTSYQSISFDETDGAITATDASSELAITNPFQVPVEISRLTGSSAFVLNFIDPNSAAKTQELAEDFEDHRFRLTTLRIKTSRGDELARTPTIFNLLFPYSWRAWDVPGGWFLRPGEYYKILVKTSELDYTPNPLELGRVQFAITAVGYREIDAQALITAAAGGTQT